MLRKSLSLLLAVVIIIGVFNALPSTFNAQEIELTDNGVNIDLAETGNPYDPYATWNGAWANCTYWAWQYAYDYDGIALPTWGDARYWYGGASGIYSCDKTPSAHSIMCTGSGNFGHVAYVTDFNSSTGKVYIKQGGIRNTSDGRDERWVSAYPSDLQGYIHLGDSDTHYGAEWINFDGANASNISFFDATIGCWMRNHNSYNIRAYGFYLGNNHDHLVQYTIGQNVKWTDSYIQANLSDYVGRLSQGVQYYYRFFSLTDGYNLSPVYSFTTSGNSTVTFDNVASSNTDNDNMTIECWVRNRQGLNISKYGLYYGTALNNMNECIEVGNNVSWTDFHINIMIIDQNIELKPNTTYYYQFFALTDGWNYSNVYSFTTGNYVPQKCSEFDVNFWVDGKDQVNIDGIGEIQVYVNGQIQGYGTDFCKNVPHGKPYEVKVGITNPDYHFAGVDTTMDGYYGLTGITSSTTTKVRLVLCKDTDGINNITNGSYVIASALNTSYGLDIAGSELPAQNNTNVSLWTIGDTIRPEDTFTLTYLGNGYYSIKQFGTDMAVDVKGALPNAQANIQMFSSNNNDNQQWKICYDSSINAYTLQSKCSGLYLTVQGGSAQNGSNIYQNVKSTIPEAQGWILIPYIQTKPIDPTTILIGDVDGDGEVEIRDSTWIQRHVTEVEMPFVINKTTADVDGDGIITVMDATAIQYYLANIKNLYHIGGTI